MTPDQVMYEIRLGVSELEESSLNVIGEAVTQDGNPIVIYQDDPMLEGTGDCFSVVVIRGDVRNAKG